MREASYSLKWPQCRHGPLSQNLSVSTKLHIHAWLLQAWLLVRVWIWCANQNCKQYGLGIYHSSSCLFQAVLAKEQQLLPIQTTFTLKNIVALVHVCPFYKLGLFRKKLEFWIQGRGWGWSIIVLNIESPYGEIFCYLRGKMLLFIITLSLNHLLLSSAHLIYGWVSGCAVNARLFFCKSPFFQGGWSLCCLPFPFRQYSTSLLFSLLLTPVSICQLLADVREAQIKELGSGRLKGWTVFLFHCFSKLLFFFSFRGNRTVFTLEYARTIWICPYICEIVWICPRIS